MHKLPTYHPYAQNAAQAITERSTAIPASNPKPHTGSTAVYPLPMHVPYAQNGSESITGALRGYPVDEPKQPQSYLTTYLCVFIIILGPAFLNSMLGVSS